MGSAYFNIQAIKTENAQANSIFRSQSQSTSLITSHFLYFSF